MTRCARISRGSGWRANCEAGRWGSNLGVVHTMDDTNRPGVIRFLIYVIAAAGLAGGLAGWVQSTGAGDWASELEAPTWTVGSNISVLIGVLMIPAMAISLWLCQRSGRDGLRILCSLLIAGALALMITHMLIFFGARDVSLGFIASWAAGSTSCLSPDWSADVRVRPATFYGRSSSGTRSV